VVPDEPSQQSPQRQRLKAVEEPEGSSKVSETASESELIGDTGPGFDSAAAPPPPSGPAALSVPELVPAVDEQQIRDLLLTGGDGLHLLFGVGELDWVMTQRDLERIAPPLTRIINRYEPLARVAGQSDFLLVAFGSGMYAWRSMLERQAVLQAREAEQAGQEARLVPERPEPGAGAVNPASVAEIPDDYETYAERLARTRAPQSTQPKPEE
jgi:hypothetical protein